MAYCLGNSIHGKLASRQKHYGERIWWKKALWKQREIKKEDKGYTFICIQRPTSTQVHLLQHIQILNSTVDESVDENSAAIIQSLFKNPTSVHIQLWCVWCRDMLDSILCVKAAPKLSKLTYRLLINFKSSSRDLGYISKSPLKNHTKNLTMALA